MTYENIDKEAMRLAWKYYQDSHTDKESAARAKFEMMMRTLELLEIDTKPKDIYNDEITLVNLRQVGEKLDREGYKLDSFTGKLILSQTRVVDEI